MEKSFITLTTGRLKPATEHFYRPGSSSSSSDLFQLPQVSTFCTQCVTGKVRRAALSF